MVKLSVSEVDVSIIKLIVTSIPGYEEWNEKLKSTHYIQICNP